MPTCTAAGVQQPASSSLAPAAPGARLPPGPPPARAASPSLGHAGPQKRARQTASHVQESARIETDAQRSARDVRA
eukprot:2061337-Alexandrium_andersonii.AAC.1